MTVTANQVLAGVGLILVLAVAVILYDAGPGLDLRHLHGHTRRIVTRLIVVGVPITLAFGFLRRAAAGHVGAGGRDDRRHSRRLRADRRGSAAELHPPGRTAAARAHLGRITDRSGRRHPRRGGIQRHSSDHHEGPGYEIGQFLIGIGAGVVGGVIGIAVLWFLLRKLRLGEVLGTASQLAAVVGVAAACDIVRDDAGLVAAVMMGLAVANMHGFDAPARRPFFETLVQLIIGVLFISISATVTPASLRHLILPTLGLVAVLVLVTRPLVAQLAALRTDMPKAERWFTGWMAPRGIVAAASASTFSAGLVSHGIAGAAKILPVTFLVIVATVTLYGLTAAPVARRLGVTRPDRTRPLLVGGEAWVIDLACGLRSAGLDVLMWAGVEEQRERIRNAGLELAPGELLAAATGRGALLEGINAVLLLTTEDDFNALAAAVLAGSVEGPVYRIGPQLPSHGVVAPYTGGEILFGAELTRLEVGHRYAGGARVVNRPGDDEIPPGMELLFLVRADGKLMPVTRASPPVPQPGDTMVLLESALVGS
jgi:hypothetical protein